MNLRYYLRGLGIGIIVTAIIMGFTSGKDKAAAPAADQVQTAEKGSGVLADLETEPAAELRENVVPEQTFQDPEDMTQPESEPAADEEGEDQTVDRDQESEGEDSAAAEPESEQEESSPDGDSILIEISEGDSSYAVSMKLEEAGLIASASAFDRYLYDNGYDRKLRFGTYEIPVDIEPEEIAEILAGNR